MRNTYRLSANRAECQKTFMRERNGLIFDWNIKNGVPVDAEWRSAYLLLDRYLVTCFYNRRQGTNCPEVASRIERLLRSICGKQIFVFLKLKSIRMKTKSQKQAELKSLLEKLPKSTITIFTTFAREGEKGLSVAQMQELKRALRKLGSEYLVAKKSLVDIAAKELKYDGLDVFSTLQGSVGIVIGHDDAYVLSKSLYDFAKKNQALKYFGAFYDGKFIGQEAFVEMATMPSHEQLLAQLFGMIQYPLTALAIVLDQISKQKNNE